MASITRILQSSEIKKTPNNARSVQKVRSRTISPRRYEEKNWISNRKRGDQDKLSVSDFKLSPKKWVPPEKSIWGEEKDDFSLFSKKKNKTELDKNEEKKPWHPIKRLPRNQMEEIRYLYDTDPANNSIMKLSKKFGIGFVEAAKIVKFRGFQPDEERIEKQDKNKQMEFNIYRTKGRDVYRIKEEIEILNKIRDIFLKDPKDEQALLHMTKTAQNIIHIASRLKE
eukprot:TRINITY_DN15148_c0_g1_i1.p1 TRINITY_DN15148_c0_g1~~TRINITY_DN15148_c0_g1_i1.p1  ORF type:complete len:226 (+),score=77.46 TRINITY_DN15148_c0_g1_i1:39-716(+)